MKIPRIVNAIGFVDDDLIALTEESTRRPRVTWMRWTAVAACAVLLIVAAAVMPQFFAREKKPPVTPDIDIGQKQPTEERYKDIHVQTGDSAIVWRWEYQTVVEQYTSIDVEGVEFVTRGSEVSASLIGESRGTYEASGWDEFTDEEHHEHFEVYEITGVSPEVLLAVKMEGRYYAFLLDMLRREPPATFGTVLNEYGLAANVTLDRVSFTDKEGYFALSEDDYVWSVLSTCTEAPVANAEGWHGTERQYISFTVTSETLGVYKHVLYVTEDGYVWTNAYNIEMVYFIGEEAAGKIIEHVNAHATPTESEPFIESIVGKITAITETYLIVDDSILCKDPADGITFKVPLDDLRISRYVDCGVVRVGQTVQVEYKGAINDNTVVGAWAIHEAILTEDGMVLIPD